MQLKQYFMGNRLEIAISLVILLILVMAVPLASRYFIPYIYDLGEQLPFIPVKLSIFAFFGGLVASLAAMGSWLVYAGLRSSHWNAGAKKERIQRYLSFREYLQQFLWIAGLMLGLTILAAGAFSKVHTSMEREYSPLFVLAYGASLTIILILIYIPIYNSLVAVGRKLCDLFLPMPLPNSKSWMDVYSKRIPTSEYNRWEESSG